MASIQKTEKGWCAQVKKRGVRESRLFSTKRDAVAGADEREAQIEMRAVAPLSAQYTNIQFTLRDALRRYAE